MYLETSDELEVNEYYFRRSKDGPILYRRQKFGLMSQLQLRARPEVMWAGFLISTYRSENGEFSRFWKEPWEFRFKDRQLNPKKWMYKSKKSIHQKSRHSEKSRNCT